MRRARTLTTALTIWVAASAAVAAEQTYDSRRAGHPLRVAAYALHPFGVILDWLIFRPAWYVGGVEPIRTLVGRDLEPRDVPIDPVDLIPPPAPAEPEPQP
jgi:hypothetical protein